MAAPPSALLLPLRPYPRLRLNLVERWFAELTNSGFHARPIGPWPT